MVEERRWPLGNKVTELHAGEETGFISSIKWKDTLIAWCYSKSQVLQVKQNLGIWSANYIVVTEIYITLTKQPD